MIKTIRKLIEYPQEEIIKRLYCDECGSLMYRDTDILTSLPPQYVYYCTNCGMQITSKEIYNNPVRSSMYDKVVVPM